MLPDGSLPSVKMLAETAQALADKFSLQVGNNDSHQGILQLQYKEVNRDQGGPLRMERGVVGQSMRPIVMPAAELVVHINDQEHRVDTSLDHK